MEIYFPGANGSQSLSHLIRIVEVGERKSRLNMHIPLSGMVDNSGPKLYKPPDDQSKLLATVELCSERGAEKRQ
jgi:hypothetical protein